MNARFQCFTRHRSISWRLLSGNHRSLAMSAQAFPTLEAAFRDAELVRANAAEAEIELSYGRDTTWTWLLTLDGQPRAVAGVQYTRRLECLRAVDRFRLLAPTAPLIPALLPDPHRLVRATTSGLGPPRH